MKKLFILSALIFSTPLFAQTSTRNVKSSSDIDVYTYTIAPNVSINPPMWSKNLNNSIINSTSQKDISINENSGLVPDSIPIIKSPDSGVSNISSNIFSANNIKNIQPSQSAASTQDAVLIENSKKPISTIRIMPKSAIIVGNISTWNKTTQQQIEANSNIDLQEKYKEFLKQR